MALTMLFLPIAGSVILIFFLQPVGGWLRDSAAMVFAGAGISALDPQNSRDMVALTIGITASLVSVVVIARQSKSIVGGREP